MKLWSLRNFVFCLWKLLTCLKFWTIICHLGWLERGWVEKEAEYFSISAKLSSSGFSSEASSVLLPFASSSSGGPPLVLGFLCFYFQKQFHKSFINTNVAAVPPMALPVPFLKDLNKDPSTHAERETAPRAGLVTFLVLSRWSGLKLLLFSSAQLPLTNMAICNALTDYIE